MRAWISRLEHDKIAFRSRNGHRTRTNRGGGLGFGYEDNKIKPDEFRILWLIHYMHLAGVSYQKIADHLELGGLKTRENRPFSKQWVYNLCKQKKMEFFDNKTPAESLTRITSYNVCYTKLLRPAGRSKKPAAATETP